jgi:hypothetical protein
LPSGSQNAAFFDKPLGDLEIVNANRQVRPARRPGRPRGPRRLVARHAFQQRAIGGAQQPNRLVVPELLGVEPFGQIIDHAIDPFDHGLKLFPREEVPHD